MRIIVEFIHGHRCACLLSYEAKVFVVLWREEIFDEEGFVLLDVLGETECVNRWKSFVDVVDQLDVSSNRRADVLEQVQHTVDIRTRLVNAATIALTRAEFRVDFDLLGNNPRSFRRWDIRRHTQLHVVKFPRHESSDVIFNFSRSAATGYNVTGRRLRHRTLSTTQLITGGQRVARFFVRSQVHPQVAITDNALSAFEQLAADEPAVANQVLFSAVGVLANLQATRAAKAELKRRVERVLFGLNPPNRIPPGVSWENFYVEQTTADE